MIWQGSPLGFDASGRPISHDGNEPTLIVGPMGVNKSMGHAASALLDDDGRRSFFVWEPSFELAAICANWRRKVCGRKNVKLVNSYGVLAKERPDLKSDKWNPLAGLSKATPNLSDVCSGIAAALVPENSNEHQRHFVDAARSLVAGMVKAEILEAEANGQMPSLPNVRARLALNSDALAKLIKEMIAKTTDFDLHTRLSRFSAAGAGDERQSVLANVESATAWMSEALVNDMTVKEGVRLEALRDRPTTIFCGIPPEYEKPEVMRLLLSSVLRACYRADGVPVTLLIDEAYVLGRHAEVTKALSVLRKYNCRMSIIFQSTGQIERLYPEDCDLFTSGAVMMFRASGEKSARAMSFRAGEKMVASPTYADPSSPSDLGVRPSWGPQKRERIPASKMFSMPRGKALVFLPGDEAPRISRVKGYFDIPELARRADPNPYYKPPPAAAPAGRRRLGLAAAVIVAGFAAAGVALWPRAARLGEESAAGFAMHNRAESAHHPAAPRKVQSAVRRKETPAIGGFP